MIIHLAPNHSIVMMMIMTENVLKWKMKDWILKLNKTLFYKKETSESEKYSQRDDGDDIIFDYYITFDNHSSNEYDSGLFTFLFENADELCTRLRIFSQ